jgi:hypothetical protein
MNVRNPYQSVPAPAAAPPPATPVEPSAREKIARFKTLSGRAFRYWKLTFVILILGMATSLAVALTVKLTYRSECTVLYRNAMRPGEHDEELSAERSRQIGAKLKDLLTTRSRLEALIEQYNLYPKIVATKGVVDAVDEMRLHIGFRARDSQTYVISFETDVPLLARDVTKSPDRLDDRGLHLDRHEHRQARGGLSGEAGVHRRDQPREREQGARDVLDRSSRVRGRGEDRLRSRRRGRRRRRRDDSGAGDPERSDA